MTWFIYSILSFTLFGITVGLYKLPASKKQSKLAVNFWMTIFTFALTGIIFHNHWQYISIDLLLFSAAWGICFSSITALQMYALKHVDVNVLFPNTSILSLIVSIILGLIFFKDTLSIFQVIGIILAIVSVYLFLFKKGKLKYTKGVILLGTAIFSISVFLKIIQKFAVDAVNFKTLMIFEYLAAAIVTLFLIFIFHKSKAKQKIFSGAIRSGLFISLPLFLGGWAMMLALKNGPFSLVIALHSMYIFIAALTAFLLFKEKLDKNKIFLLFLAILAILFIRLG